jgi:hypothetical protein
VAPAGATKPVARVLVPFGLVVVLLLLVGWFALRVPSNRWERAEVQLDLIPVEDLGLDLSDPADSESGARWRLFFGEDSRLTRTYLVNQEVDFESVCGRMDALGAAHRGDDYRYQSRIEETFKICSVSYRVFDLQRDYIDVTWSLRRNRKGEILLLLFGERPHVLVGLEPET